MNGFPLFRFQNEQELLVLSRSSKPIWVPVTREEVANLFIRFWQQNSAKVSGDPVTQSYVNGYKAALAAMSPAERGMAARYTGTSAPTVLPLAPWAAVMVTRS